MITSTQLRSAFQCFRRYVREHSKRMLSILSCVRGLRILTRDETMRLVVGFGQNYEGGRLATLTKVGVIESLEILSCGVIRVNRRDCLLTDFGNRGAITDMHIPTFRVREALAVWSHDWLGYYHFVSELIPKILHAQEILGDKFADLHIVFPRTWRAYETDFFRELGIPPEQIIDSKSIGGVICDVVHFVPMIGWFRGKPNIELLRKRLIGSRNHNASSGRPKLIYLPRSGRRRCLNDEEIIEELLPLGFHVITEGERSIREQADLFSNARCIVAPHGAALTNMVWSYPGCVIIEIMPSTYDVEYYQELASSLEHIYHKIICMNGRTARSGVAIDYTADKIEVLRVVHKCLPCINLDS